jgi:hypothetical protein
MCHGPMTLPNQDFPCPVLLHWDPVCSRASTPHTYMQGQRAMVHIRYPLYGYTAWRSSMHWQHGS